MIEYLAYQIFFAGPIKNSLPQVTADEGTFARGLNIIFIIAGAITVLVITVAGLFYVLSQGDPSKTSRAKNAIIYAAVGLIVIVLSGVIVNFVFQF